MDFDLSPEQQQLSDAIVRWTEKDYSFEKRKQIIHSDTGTSARMAGAVRAGRAGLAGAFGS